MFVGIDGGGSTVRVVVVKPDLTVIGSSRGGNVNPNSAGRDHAAITLQKAVHEALSSAGIGSEAITAVGAGVAGTMNPMLAVWLREALSAIAPDKPIYTTHDLEIALIGAHGERHGVIVVAGTGSAAFGVNDAGESLLVGGWGYLLGDEGGGAWIGLQALKKVITFADEGVTIPLAERLFDLLQISDARLLVDIVYQPGVPVAPRLARFAPYILEWAAHDTTANGIIYTASTRLHALVKRLQRRLKLDDPPVAFSGGLLSEPNLLSRGLQQHLNLADFPQPKYPPEIGAVLYAMEMMRKQP